MYLSGPRISLRVTECILSECNNRHLATCTSGRFSCELFQHDVVMNRDSCRMMTEKITTFWLSSAWYRATGNRKMKFYCEKNQLVERRSCSERKVLMVNTDDSSVVWFRSASKTNSAFQRKLDLVWKGIILVSFSIQIPNLPPLIVTSEIWTSNEQAKSREGVWAWKII